VYASNITLISAQDTKKLYDSDNAVIIDVRESNEFKDGVVKNAILLPLSLMTNNKSVFEKEISKIPHHKTVIVYCASGRRAGVVGAEIARMGFKVFNMEKFNNWKAAGFPIDHVRPKGKI
jgi:rhodanese-related sulfurtransferase